MINLPDGKVCRNLPEQVAENLKKIQEIIHFLDGVNIQDNLVVIADLSQILTEAELEIVERPVAFIYYNAELFIKKNEAAGVAYFVNVFSIEDTGTQLNFNSHEMQVNLGTGALTYTTATATSYTKSQIDSLLALKADLSGAEFTGAVKALTFEQTNANYSYDLDTAWSTLAVALNGMTLEPIYNRFEVINNAAYLVINLKIVNNTGAAANLTAAAYFATKEITIDHNLALKIFDLEKNSVSTNQNNVLITQTEAKVIRLASYNSESVADGRINLLNSGVDKLNVFLKTLSTVSIPDGESRIFSGRLFLTTL